MIKILKLVKSLMLKGFATSEEKAQLRVMFKNAEADEQEAVQEEVEKVEGLPSSDPASDEAELEKNIKTIVVNAVKTATKAESEKATAEIKSEVKAWLETQKSAIEAKAGMYNKTVVEKRAGLNVYMRKFMSALMNNDVSEMVKLNGFATTKELTTDSTGSPFGGYVTDRELSAEIRVLITEYGTARREMMAIPLSKNSYAANELATDISVGWVTEGGSILSGSIVIGQESLKLCKMAAIVTATRELLEDQEIDLFTFIATRVAEGFAKAEDKAFFTGAGAGDTANCEFLGLLNNTNCNKTITGSVAFADLSAEDLLSMQDDSPQYVAANGKYYMHRSIRNIIRKLKTTEGVFVYQSPSETGPALIWGRPVVEVEVLPSIADTDNDTPFVIYGDLKKSSILGYKNGISVDRFNAGVIRNVADDGDINLITSDREAVRWIERVGAMTILPKAATVLWTKVS